MNNLNVANPKLPTSLKDILFWGVGIAAATWLSWYVNKALQGYEELKQVHTGVPHPE